MPPQNTSNAVLDSSALLAVLLGEPGADAVSIYLPGALISTVNIAETIAKLVERGMPAEQAGLAIEAVGVEAISFDNGQAVRSGALRAVTRDLGLSLGDRACLTLAADQGLPAVTADRAWTSVPGANVVVIRSNSP